MHVSKRKMEDGGWGWGWLLKLSTDGPHHFWCVDFDILIFWYFHFETFILPSLEFWTFSFELSWALSEWNDMIWNGMEWNQSNLIAKVPSIQELPFVLLCFALHCTAWLPQWIEESIHHFESRLALGLSFPFQPVNQRLLSIELSLLVWYLLLDIYCLILLLDIYCLMDGFCVLCSVFCIDRLIDLIWFDLK